jgi:hypothetical protein
VFTVFIDDNFHGPGEGAYRLGDFATWEDAVAAARRVVDRCLEEAYRPGVGPADPYAACRLFGDDPFIVPAPVGGGVLRLGLRQAEVRGAVRRRRAGWPTGGGWGRQRVERQERSLRPGRRGCRLRLAFLLTGPSGWHEPSGQGFQRGGPRMSNPGSRPAGRSWREVGRGPTRRRGPSGRAVVLASVAGLWAACALLVWAAVLDYKPPPDGGVQGVRRPGVWVGGDPRDAEGEFAVWVTAQAGIACAVLSAAMLWAARDARARGVKGWEWLPLLVALSGGLFVLLHLAGRPAGSLAACRVCGLPRLASAPPCPHCGAGAERQA